MTNRDLKSEWAPYADGVGGDRSEDESRNQSGGMRDRRHPFSNPSGMILVTDASHIPDTLVTHLLAPDTDGRVGAILTDREFTWYPPYTNDRELELMFNNSTVKEPCAFCGSYFRTEHLQVSWEGRAVCDKCMPVEMRKLRDIGYDWAKEFSIEAEADAAGYLDVLADFADRLSQKE